MSRLTWYMVRTILGFTAIAGLALVAIYTFVSFVSEIDETGKGGFGMVELLWYTLMMIPTGLYTLMPIIALLGTLMGLGALAAQNEITAMRAAGMTIFGLGRAVMVAGMLLGGLALVLGDWIAPAGTLAARNFRNQSSYQVAGGISAEPIWLRDGRQIVHIRVLQTERTMANVDIYALGEDLSLQEILRVGSARYSGGRWILRDVDETRFSADGVTRRQLPTMDWNGSLSPDVLKLFVLEANSLSTPGLMRLIGFMRANGLDASSYLQNLWRKLVAPFTVVALMLFAVPFVLGSQRGGGAGQRLLVGIVVGLVFYVVNEVTGSYGRLYGWPSGVSASLPTVLLALLAFWRMQRAR